MIKPYMGNPALQQFVLYQTQPQTWLGGMTEWDGAEPINHDMSVVTGLGTAAGAYTVNRLWTWYKKNPTKKISKRALGTLALATFGIAELIQYGDRVTDPMNNQGGSLRGGPILDLEGSYATANGLAKLFITFALAV